MTQISLQNPLLLQFDCHKLDFSHFPWIEIFYDKDDIHLFMRESGHLETAVPNCTADRLRFKKPKYFYGNFRASQESIQAGLTFQDELNLADLESRS
jgi:hypothetical protein